MLPEFAEVLDDPVMHHGQLVGRVRMGVALGRSAVGRPAGVPDPHAALKRLLDQPSLEIAKLTLGAPPGEMPVFQRRNASRIIAAILKPLQRIYDKRCDRTGSEYSNNSAHGSKIPV